MKTIIITLCLFCTANITLAQSAKEYYLQSETAQKNGEYSDAIVYAEKAKSQLGNTNPKIESLLMMAYFNNGDMVNAKIAYKTLLKVTPYSRQQTPEFIDFVAMGKEIDIALTKKEEEYKEEKNNQLAIGMRKANEVEKAYNKKFEAKKTALKSRNPEERLFEKAKLANNLEYLTEFINAYPSSSYSKEATKELRFIEIAKEVKPAIEQDLIDLENLVEGKPYLVTSRAKLTSSTKEISILIFYGSQYIIYTIPDNNIAKNLNKDKVSFYLSERDQDGYVNVKIASTYGSKQKMAFKKSIHYSNVYFGGYGADILWSGNQNSVFDYNLHFYYYFNSLHCDAKIKTSFQKDYYNPYIETGEINKMIDYNVVKDPALLTKIKVNEIQNISGVENAIKEGVSLAFKPSGNIKMIYPLKKITYNYVETVKGKYAADGKEYKGEFLYFTPGKATNHYGYQQYDVAYPKAKLLTSIADVNTPYKMSRTSFNSIYKAFSDSKNKSAYFSNSEYVDFYNAIFELVKGEKSNMPIIGTRSKGTTQHSTPIIENNLETDKNKEEHEEINGTNRHGYINLNELVNNSPEYKSIVLKLEELNEIETSIIKLKEIDLTEKLNQYQKEEPSKTKEENELRAKEIEDIQQDIQEYSMNANTELVRKQTELIDSLMGKIIIIIQEVANSKKISTVIDSSNLKGGVLIVGDIDLFMQNGYNLMTDVKKELGIK